MCPCVQFFYQYNYYTAYSLVENGEQWIYRIHPSQEETSELLRKGYKMDFHSLQFAITGKSG